MDNDKGFLNKRILYFDSRPTDYILSIKKSIERQGGIVDFYSFQNDTFYSRVLKNTNHLLYLKNKKKKLHKILNQIKSNRYDSILIKSPFEAPTSFFEELNYLFPNTVKINYNWSSIKKFDYLPYTKYFTKIISFDPKDCQNYNLEYFPLFYIDIYDQLRKNGDVRPNTDINVDIDLLFIGSAQAEARYEFIKKIENYCKKEGLNFYYYLYQSRFGYVKSLLKGKYISNVKHKFLSHNEIIEYFKRAKVIIDSPMDIQSGLTIRTFETLGAGKKLITTNNNIKNEPFYNKEYINIIDKTNPILDIDFIKDYKYNWNPIMKNYYVDNWIRRLILNE